MTTRAGTAYNNDNRKQMEELHEERRGLEEEERRGGVQEGRDGNAMVEVMQLLVEDRRRRETELAEERRQWEEREMEYDEERRRRQAEAAMSQCGKWHCCRDWWRGYISKVKWQNDGQKMTER